MARLAAAAREMGRTRSLALGGAALWCIALIVAAFVVPAYSTDGSTGAGSATLVGENGAWVAGLLAIPLLLTLFVGDALWKRRAEPGAGPTAWTVTGLLIAFNVLGMLSIGIFVLPVTICLVVACTHPNVTAGHPEVSASS